MFLFPMHSSNDNKHEIAHVNYIGCHRKLRKQSKTRTRFCFVADRKIKLTHSEFILLGLLLAVMESSFFFLYMICFFLHLCKSQRIAKKKNRREEKTKKQIKCRHWFSSFRH